MNINKNKSWFLLLKYDYFFTYKNMILKITLIFLALLFALIFYTFIRRRLKYINEKHISHTQVPYLRKNYIYIMSIISFLAIISIVLSIILILILL